MRVFLVLVFVAMSWMQASAQSLCTGIVTGPGGKRLAMAHVALLTPDAVSVLQVVQAAPTGEYSVSLPHPGFWILRFAGVGYADHSVALYTEDQEPVELRVALGCHRYPPGEPRITVIGDFNVWNIVNAVPLVKHGDGTYSAEIKAKTDSITFRLRGCRDRESVEGLLNATYVLNNEGIYNARTKTTNGVATITFDPSLLDRSGATANDVFVRAVSRTTKIADAASEWWKVDDEYFAARLAAGRGRKALDSTMFSWQPRLAHLFQLEEAERDTMVRSVLALAYVSTSVKARNSDVASTTTCMEHLAPASAAWTLNPIVISRAVRSTSWAEARREAYIRAILTSQPDRTVKEAVLFDEFTIALLSEQKDKAAGYYDILTTEYADTPVGKMVREKYSRPGTLPKGKK